MALYIKKKQQLTLLSFVLTPATDVLPVHAMSSVKLGKGQRSLTIEPIAISA